MRVFAVLLAFAADLAWNLAGAFWGFSLLALLVLWIALNQANISTGSKAYRTEQRLNQFIPATSGRINNLSGNGTTTVGLADGTIGGNTSSVGLADGTIGGTTGGASAGTAHTHGPGSFAVNNGHHTHGSGTQAVNNGTHTHNLPTV